MKRATANHPEAAAAAQEFSVVAEQERILYNQPGGWKRWDAAPPEVPLLREWDGDMEALHSPPNGADEPGPPPPRAHEGGTPRGGVGGRVSDANDPTIGPPDDRLDWLGQEAKRMELAMAGARELYKTVSTELEAARRAGRTGRSSAVVLKVALRFRIEDQERRIAEQSARIEGLVATLRTADAIAAKACSDADTLAEPSVGLMVINDGKTEGALAEYEDAIKAAAYNASATAARVEQVETAMQVLMDQLLERCGALAQRVDAEQTARLNLEKRHADLIASAGYAEQSAVEASRQRERAEAAEARAAAAEGALKIARWKLTMTVLYQARLASLTVERDDASRACTAAASRAAAAEAARDSLAEEVEELTARIAELEAALNGRPSSDAIAQARAIQVALATKLQVLRKRLTECEARAAAAEANAAALEEILAGKASELELLSLSERAAKERVVALEHELALLRSDGAERVAALEAALAASQAAHLEVSEERDALKRELRKTRRRVEELEEEIEVFKLGDQAIVPRVAKHVKPPFVPTAKTLRLVVAHILAEKAAADAHDDETPGEERQSLDHFVYDYFLLRFGIRQLAESHISAFVRGIATHWERGGGGRLGTFGALLGCLPTTSAIRGVCDGDDGDVGGSTPGGGGGGGDGAGGSSTKKEEVIGAVANDQAALSFYLHVRCAVFSRCGGVPSTELEEGVAEVPTAVVREVVTAALAPAVRAADVVTAMAAAGGGADDDALVDLDKALAAALVVWSRARALAGDRASRLFHEHDANGDGVMTWGEFSTFVEECQAGLSVREKKELFREAIKVSPTADTAAATPATVRAVSMQHGLGFLPVRLPLDSLFFWGASVGLYNLNAVDR
jgi:hypothetical protein